MKTKKIPMTPVRRVNLRMTMNPRIVLAVPLVEIHPTGTVMTKIVVRVNVLAEDAAPLPMSGRGSIRRPKSSNSPSSPLLHPLTIGKCRSAKFLSLLAADQI